MDWGKGRNLGTTLFQGLDFNFKSWIKVLRVRKFRGAKRKGLINLLRNFHWPIKVGKPLAIFKGGVGIIGGRF